MIILISEQKYKYFSDNEDEQIKELLKKDNTYLYYIITADPKTETPDVDEGYEYYFYRDGTYTEGYQEPDKDLFLEIKVERCMVNSVFLYDVSPEVLLTSHIDETQGYPVYRNINRYGVNYVLYNNSGDYSGPYYDSVLYVKAS